MDESSQLSVLPFEHVGQFSRAALVFFALMNADLLHAARAIVPNDHLLVNVVRLRVRQLLSGHRARVIAPPGAGTADIALMEIIQNRIGCAPTVAVDQASSLPAVLEFPGVPVKKKAA